MGTAVRADALQTDAQYAAIAGSRYDVVVPENELKWAATEPARGHFDFAPGDRIVSFALARHQHVHGHALAWSAQNPAWLEHGTFTRDEAVTILRSHIAAVVGHYKGQVELWDVVNEAFAQNSNGQLAPNVWTRLIGPDYIDIAFRAAHEADPAALLVYNDFAIETPGARVNQVVALVRKLKRTGVPIDGVGLQMHVNTPGPTSGDLDAVMASFRDAGARVAVTEMDVALGVPPTPAALDAQADVYRRVLAACRHADCVTFTTWGFTDKYSWVPAVIPGSGAALPWDERFRTKPAYEAIAGALRP